MFRILAIHPPPTVMRPMVIRATEANNRWHMTPSTIPQAFLGICLKKYPFTPELIVGTEKCPKPFLLMTPRNWG